MGGVVKGAAGLVKDALTFRWASATVGDATVNAIIVAEVGSGEKLNKLYSHRDFISNCRSLVGFSSENASGRAV